MMAELRHHLLIPHKKRRSILKKMNKQKKNLFPWLMLSPFLIIISMFVILPIILMVVMSFTDMGLTLQWNFVGMKNYDWIIHYPGLHKIITRSIIFVGINTILSVLGSIFLSVIATYYLDIVYKRENAGILFRIIWLIPSLTPSVVYAFIWKFIFGTTEKGMLNGMFAALGMPTVSWFSKYPMQIMMLICSLSSASGSIILFASAIRQIPENIIQAAKVDGASNLRICREIVIPYLRWPITQKTLWSILGFFCTYEIIRLMTEGGPMGKTTIFSYYIYQHGFNLKKFGMGAALSVFLVSLSIIIGMIVLRIFKVEKQLQDPRMDL